MTREGIHEKFESEAKSFKRLKKDLLKDPDYLSRYIAVVDGNVVDDDTDDGKLVSRVYRNYGYRPLYIGKIEAGETTLDAPSVYINPTDLSIDGFDRMRAVGSPSEGTVTENNIYWTASSIQVVDYIASTLNRKVYVVGIRAIYEYGVPIHRGTTDTDVYSQLTGEEWDGLKKFIRKAYPKTAEHWRMFGSSFVFPNKERVDVMRSSEIFDRLYDKEWDKKPQKLNDAIVYIPPLEDIIVSKLAGGGSKDLDDVKHVINTAWDKLDQKRLLKNTRRSGHYKKLQRMAKVYGHTI